MAVAKKNPLIQGVSGKFGNSIVFRQKGDQTILAIPPGKRTKKPTQGQEEHQQKFSNAAMYAKAQIADPVSRAEYEEGIKSSDDTAYTVAVSDFMKSPSVSALDSSLYKGKKGEVIRIRAVDDFKVKSVKLQIVAADGSVVEEGQAIQQPNAVDWNYTGSTSIADLAGLKMVAFATDKPGNVGSLEKVF